MDTIKILKQFKTISTFFDDYSNAGHQEKYSYKFSKNIAVMQVPRYYLKMCFLCSFFNWETKKRTGEKMKPFGRMFPLLVNFHSFNLLITASVAAARKSICPARLIPIQTYSPPSVACALSIYRMPSRTTCSWGRGDPSDLFQSR